MSPKKFVSKKKLGRKINVSKKFSVKKFFVSKKFLGEKKFGRKTYFGRKKLSTFYVFKGLFFMILVLIVINMVKMCFAFCAYRSCACYG